MTLVVFVLVAGFACGAGWVLALLALLRGGMNPTLVVALGIAGPLLALFLGLTA